MADLRYQVLVETSQAQRNLKGLQNNVGTLGNRFGGLKSAIAAVGFAQLIRGSISTTVALKNMSDATGIAVRSIDGFAMAIAAAGGTADRALAGISDLTKNIGSAAEGSAELQKSFAQVGISLQDLATLDEGSILRETIRGLAEMPDSATRTATAMRLLGESVKGVNLQQVNRDLDGYISRSRLSAENLDSIQKSQAALSQATRSLQNSVVSALAPIAEAINRLDNQQIADIVDSLVKIAAAAGALAATAKVIGLLGAGFAALKASAAIAAAGVATLTGTAARTVTQIGGFRKAFAAATGPAAKLGAIFTTIGVTFSKRLPFLLAGFGKLIPFVVAAAAVMFVLNEAVKAVTGTSLAAWIGRGIDRVKELFGLASNPPDVVDPGVQNAVRAQQRLIENRRVINQLLDQERKKIADSTAAYQKQNAEFARQFSQQTRMLNMTDEQRVVEETMSTAQQNYLNAIAPMLQRIQELKASTNQNDLAAIPVIQAGIESITKEYHAQLPALQALLDQRLKEMGIQKQQLELEEQIRRATERRTVAQQAVNDIMLQGQKRVQAAYDQAQLSGLSGIAATLKQIEIEERRVAEAARERVQAQFGDNDPDGLAKAMRAIDNASAGVVRARARAARAIANEQRSFSAGWSRAFREYRDAARDNSKLAESLFSTATRGMEDALVEFAKTGKFSFRDLVADMSEQLLRSQIQKTIGSLGDALGLGGLFGGSGGGAGRGNSANNPLFVQDVSGGGGVGGALAGAMGSKPGQPGLLSRAGSAISGLFGGKTAADGTKQPGLLSRAGSAIGGLFGGSRPTDGVGPTQPGLLSRAGSAIGRVFSGGRPGGDQQPSLLQRAGSAIGSLFGGSQPNRTPGINPSANKSGGGFLSSLASGAKSLFKGFFANGGVIPAGKFGMVGERGPELISGPAGITPLSGMGGTTTVTYNISAVDAPSFQALVARDPGFIHAVAQQGARGMPIGRR